MRFVETIMVALVFTSPGMTKAADYLPNRTIDPNAPMDFKYTGNGGNIKGSDWIAAEGTITADTPNRFKAFLVKTIARNTFVQFNSPGGNLVAALKLGEMIRAAHLDTSVGRTVFNQDGGMWSGVLPGVCVSACAYAFLGGEMRVVGESELGVHQFYDNRALDEPEKKAFSAIDVSIDQVLGGLVLDYVLRMGVDAGLVSLAERTSPWEMHYLTSVELKNFRVANTSFTDTGWKIEARSGGAMLMITSTYSTRPPVTMTLVCRRGKAGAYLIITSSTAYLDRWLSEGYGAPRPLTAQEVAKSLKGSEISGLGWKTSLGSDAVTYLDIDQSRRTTIVTSLSADIIKLMHDGGVLIFNPEFPIEFAGFLYVQIGSNLPSEALDLVLRNCTS
jgi:hypothetical protein